MLPTENNWKYLRRDVAGEWMGGKKRFRAINSKAFLYITDLNIMKKVFFHLMLSLKTVAKIHYIFYDQVLIIN